MTNNTFWVEWIFF